MKPGVSLSTTKLANVGPGEAVQLAADYDGVGSFEWLADAGKREEMRRGLAEVAATLGEPGASARTAALALELIEARKERR